MQFAFLIGMIIVGLYYTASAAARSWAARLRLCSLGPPTGRPGISGDVRKLLGTRSSQVVLICRRRWDYLHTVGVSGSSPLAPTNF